MSLVLDAGALLAIERRDRRVGALLRVAQQERIVVRTKPCRGGPGVAPRCTSGPVGADPGRCGGPAAGSGYPKRLGLLLGATESCDVVDPHVASLARTGDRIVTSDPDDLRRLLDALPVDASIVPV
ncbi:MAG: hypothetical protein ACRDSH_09760 [Pseudonocardiaceae bacterium]